jgi:hypothetical protein
MSFRSALCAPLAPLVLIAAVCFAAPVTVQAQGDYLDVLTVKVKPEKLAEFQANTKKFAEANRRFNGDRWIALETVYGEANVFQFTSTRKDYADIDKAGEAEQAAGVKAFGSDLAQKLTEEFANCLLWSRSELRRRRWNLSRKAPADAAAYAKLIGESRLLRTTAVHIRPGHVSDFEDLMKEAKEAAEKNPYTAPVFVSQVIEGGGGDTFYVTTLRSAMSGFDHNPTTKEILGEEGFRKFQQITAESVESADSLMFRFNPEISNPPEEVAKVAMDFWRPKATVTSAAKPKTAEAGAPAKDATKKQ